jgi:hypothetical protein
MVILFIMIKGFLPLGLGMYSGHDFNSPGE